MTTEKIRKKFINFFSKNKHAIVESSTLWPQDDTSVLLTTAGMQQFKPYFLGEKDPVKDFGSPNLVSIQRCFRTSDIAMIGDASHCTFFEMLGNFSVGDYFKKQAIDFAWKFLIQEMRLEEKKLWATYFKGDKEVIRDSESTKCWRKYLPPEKIIGFDRQANWWGPPGNTGPCGPCSEIHYDFTGIRCSKDSKCLPNCDCGRFMELWNLVFTEYYQNNRGRLSDLPKKNIDTGMGLERLAMIVQKKNNIFTTDLFHEILTTIQNDQNFGSVNEFEDTVRARIVTDHLKGTIFLLADGVLFSNKEQGYILRRIFRRALDQYLVASYNLLPIIDQIIQLYKKVYPFLEHQRNTIIYQIQSEIKMYEKILQLDIRDLIAKMKQLKSPDETTSLEKPSSRFLTARETFKLYSTYGLSLERLKQKGFVFDESEFEKEINSHQNLSRSGAQKKFGGHGISSSEWNEDQRKKMTRLHTATHLLHQALYEILGGHVRQQGSDIDPERLRFDFDHVKKLTDKEKQRIEGLVNDKIKENLPVKFEKMSYEDAVKSGAKAFFKEKYPSVVTVYSIGTFSKEICGGPHVEHTGEIGIFKIISEKSSAAGIRRIKAMIEP